jgi:hypothetical protein
VKNFSLMMQQHTKSLGSCLFAVLLAMACLGHLAVAQSATAGDIAGTVTDPTGAAIPGATVSATNVSTGETRTAITGNSGSYRLSLLSPGLYKVTIGSSSFSTVTEAVTVSIGTISTDNVKLSIGSSRTVVEVSAAPEIVNTTNADVTTTFTAEQVASLPNPGNDLTFVAQTAPGTVMNTGTAAGGYGNFSSFGISGLSNMFTLDGGYENDPFLNLNNTGASNLTLGNNEVDTVTVVAPAYSSQFGGLGGAQVNEVTISGGNRVHGNLSYYWDGRVLNSNDFFNKQQEAVNGTQNIPTFVNANQYAASIGGPIIHDKLFWFVNTEGIRAVTPAQGTVYAPNTALQNCINGSDPGGTVTIPGYGALSGTGSDVVTYTSCAGLNTTADADCIAGTNAGSVGTLCGAGAFQPAAPGQLAQMQRVFSTYNNSPYRPAASSVHQDPNDPSLVTYFGGGSELLTEWLLTARLDYKIGDKDNFFIHYKQDHGTQPTYVDTISPLFTDQSPQPAWEGQINETHSFTPNLVNQLVVTGNYYSAPFKNNNPVAAVAAAAPSSFEFLNGDNAGTLYGGIDYAFPEGRNVAGYQVIDDLSWTRGRNTLRGGYNIRRDNITDSLQPRTQNPLTEGYAEDFWAGVVDYVHSQYFPVRQTQPISLYDEGWYVEDSYKVTPTFTVTAGLRIETNSNAVCHTNCFSYLTNPVSFGATAGAPTTTPYNQLITANQHQVFKSFQKYAAMPRIALNFQATPKTTIRAGFGLFTDSFPGLIADHLASNAPGNFHAAVYGPGGPGSSYVGYSPGTTNATYTNLDFGTHPLVNGYTAASQSASAFETGFYAGESDTLPPGVTVGKSISTDVAAAGAVYSTPAIQTVASKVKYPTYDEFSLAIEQRIDSKMTITALYVGNHGYQEPVSDGSPNLTNAKFAGVPTAKPYASFATITNNYSGASSNYNGGVISATRRSRDLTLQFNYQFSKALDEISNGGLEPFAPDAGDGETLINPNNLHSNYGLADYNVKHNVTSSFVYSLPKFIPGNGFLAKAVGGFEFSGDVFHQSGLPYSITQSTSSANAAADPQHPGSTKAVPSAFANGSVLLLAQKLNNSFDHHCGGSSHVENVALGTVANPCNFVSSFTTPTSFLGGQSRNSLIGPSYTNVDFGAFKTFGFNAPYLGGMKLKLGAQFFNLFNHTNFQNPAHVRQSSNSTLGGIATTVGAPTSILGSTGGADATARLIQLHGELRF